MNGDTNETCKKSFEMRFDYLYLRGNPQSSQSCPFQRIGKQNRRCNLEYPSRGTRNRENLKQFT